MATILFNEGHPGPKYAQDAPTKKQLLNNIIDGMARTRPNALWAVTPISFTSYSEGFRKVTYSALANAVNGIAWWLTDQLGSGFGKDFPTVCYMGWNDLRYVTMVLGAVKAGYKILLVSPYNSNEGNISLFNALDCQVLATTDPVPLGVPVLLDSMPKLRTITVPDVSELLEKSYKHFPFSKTFNEAKDEPLVCLHTSGTTGLPKPVIYPHDFVSTYMRMAQLASPEGFESREKQYQGTRVFMNLPPFHARYASSINALSESLANQNIVIFPLPMERATASSLVEIMKHTPVDALCAPPWMVHEIATNPEILEELVARKLDVIWYGGGDLPQQFGDIITSKFKFWNSNGSTETSPFPNIYKSGEWPADDWKYQCTHPAAGLEYRVFSDDDQLYEAVIVRNSDPEFEQPVFKLYPDLNEYSTKDLFSPHPTKEGLWTYRGRTDDMILVVVDNVATRPFNPQYMEHAVTNHPDVKDGVMVPAGKFFNERFATKTALLVDLKDSIDATALGYKEKLVEEIWTIVNGINEKYREEAWVRKECIVIAKPQKPLPRNPKGSIQRTRAMELYAKELESL
ncbi:uncharacterized protein EAE98_006876 [Botrytis deweyae]|uniref:AMP-dependent synthetase/ligase domain-containing protein n=1 Tax=Botrytis deweyae TaxID=2478750 RepID=A0ABQ7IJ01_9HELO|nr:uncharacterized protein EAE98_006876 [Botrytis deweyae]KAF7925651.1 hypothetical protein EAE98_006876 [Botrytis deweyae]